MCGDAKQDCNAPVPLRCPLHHGSSQHQCLRFHSAALLSTLNRVEEHVLQAAPVGSLAGPYIPQLEPVSNLQMPLFAHIL